MNGVTLTDAPWFQDVNDAIYDQVVNVKNSAYGAVGDGSTDDSAAILAAVNAAAALTLGAHSSRAAVYFPPGIYKLASSAALTETNAASIAAGIHFFGAGMYTSILRLAPSGSDLYFYNNVATARTQFCTFADLGFEGLAPASLSAYTDISDNAKGFRLWATTASGGHEQGFKFTRCRFFGLHTMFETAGDNTTSENSFVQCKISHMKSAVLSLNNAQSLNHTFHGTDIESIYGDVFSLASNAGGAINVHGGSIIMGSETGAATYFWRGVGATGILGSPNVFNGVRFEMRGSKTNLVLGTTLKTNIIDFENCTFFDTSTATKAAWVSVGTQNQVNFRRCSFTEETGEYIKFIAAGTAGAFGIQAQIIFDNCWLIVDWSDKCSITTTFGGSRISARNCFGTNNGATDGIAHWAHDFDLHWSAATPGQLAVWAGSGATLTDSISPSHPQWTLKTAEMKCTSEFWPGSAGFTSQHTLKLPKNAIIKEIHLRKPASGTDATSATLRVGRNDKSGTDHLVSNTDQFKNTHTGDTTNYYYHVGTTTNERTLRLYTNESPGQAIAGGFVIVEYY